MYNKIYTKADLLEAINNKDMSSLQRYSILAYYGFTPYDIRQIFHNLSKATSQDEQASKQQEQQVKKQVEKIVENTINDINKKFKS